jgi:hypothetical protein
MELVKCLQLINIINSAYLNKEQKWAMLGTSGQACISTSAITLGILPFSPFISIVFAF